MFGAPESKKEAAPERHKDDMAILQTQIDKLLEQGEPGVTVKALIRIGPKKPEDDRPRPLKVVFAGPNDPKRLLSTAYKLRGNGLIMRPDLSLEDRAKLREAATELRNRTREGETGLTIANFRVIQRKRLIQHPLVLRATMS